VGKFGFCIFRGLINIFWRGIMDSEPYEMIEYDDEDKSDSNSGEEQGIFLVSIKFNWP
jgi:hypothetical protein